MNNTPKQQTNPEGFPVLTTEEMERYLDSLADETCECPPECPCHQLVHGVNHD